MARNKAESMAIEDRLARRSPDDVIYIGGVIESFLDSEAGKLVQALLNGRIAFEARATKDPNTSSDKRMGRIEMCQMLIDDFDQYLEDRYKMIVEIRKEKPKPEPLTDGPPVY